MTGRKCAAPECNVILSAANKIGVCPRHIHTEHCRCIDCQTGAKSTLRVRTRAELVKMGLLPKTPMFRDAVIEMQEACHDSAQG